MCVRGYMYTHTHTHMHAHTVISDVGFEVGLILDSGICGPLIYFCFSIVVLY